MTYKETLEYIFAKLPMFSRIGAAAYKADLTNTIILCEHLGNPQTTFKTVHVGGTNGKGSVSHMLASVLQTNGYKTGLYTSPHLYDFRERIKINGIVIGEAFVIDFVENLMPLIEDLKPSFFEITVAMAFQYFAEQDVDVAIIEVGLGGRLDSTNIITPELSVITNIGWDHTNLLGDTLEKIAAEKGGIIKEDVPVIIGERNSITDDIFTQLAGQKNAPIYFATDQYQTEKYYWSEQSLHVEVKHVAANKTWHHTLDLPGIYQIKNICTVLQTLDLLKGRFPLNNEKIAAGLAKVKSNTGLGGRWEVVGKAPKIVLDVAHNQPGIRELVRQLALEIFEGLHIVFGLVKDKDITSVLKLLPVQATYYFTQAQIPRALASAVLQEAAKGEGLTGGVYEDVNAALRVAKENASAKDLILVCGSIFLIAEVDKSLI
jgi:dihydrofolate synthase/folylpolyglutamate synthase